MDDGSIIETIDFSEFETLFQAKKSKKDEKKKEKNDGGYLMNLEIP